MRFDYTMVEWSSGEVVESTFGEPATMTVRFGEEQEFASWGEALVDIKERGRRLAVVPEGEGYPEGSDHPAAGEPVVVVTEVVSVDTPQ